MIRLYAAMLTAVEESTEVIENVIEHNLDDVYQVLTTISNQLDSLQSTGTSLLQLLENSYLNSVAALLLVLVGFEIMRLVRGWTKGERLNGRIG